MRDILAPHPQNEATTFYEQVNHARYQGLPQGHYESFFQRANHPKRPLAFWIRYTVFSPRGHPENAIGELWAVFFNGETNSHAAVKKEVPFNECVFSTTSFDCRIGSARLDAHGLTGAAEKGADSITWDLTFHGASAPLLLLPLRLYSTRLPAAKSLVSLPLARFSGTLTVNGETIEVTDWLGSTNHNWGFKHTDLYAWGQVAGFDTEPGSFLELATARLRIGPFRTPAFTPIVFRHRGQEHSLNGLLQTVKAHGLFTYFTWNFCSKTPRVEIEGTITAPRKAFVGLTYYNPPGGTKTCLNSKIASCTLRFKDKVHGITETLQAENRAAFEILTDDTGHGIRMVV
jgi:hypothetical protein